MHNGEDFTKEILLAAEKSIGYTFKDKELLKTCFTHSTYSNMLKVKSGEEVEHNKRLEWLGDAVLQLYVSDKLYHETNATVGELTPLRQTYVSEEALTPNEKKLELTQFMRHSGGKDNVEGKTLSNLFEAVIGALYLDGGYEEAERFLAKHLEKLASKEGEN